MARQNINIGTSANAGNGDPLRTAMIKINANFDEVYTKLNQLEDGELTSDIKGSLFGDDSILLVDGINNSINLDGTVKGDIIPDVDNAYDLGAADKQFRSLYVSGSTIYLGGAALKIDNEGELTLNDNRIVQQNGQYIDLNSNVNDVNVSNPQPGDTLQWGPGFWINVPNSDHKLVSGAKEVVLTGGTNPFVTFPAVASGENIIIQGAEIASTTGTVAVTSSGSVVINTNALTALNTWTFGNDGNLALPSGFITSNQVTGLNLRSDYDVHIISNHMDVNHEWILDSYGDLTIPGGIKSEGAINIDINLSDSTLRRWTFGEDGNTEFPGAITVPGTITGNILKIEDGVHEKFQTKSSATGTVTHDCSAGHIFFHTLASSNWTANFTNLNLASGYATTVTLVIEQGGTGYYPNAVQIGGNGVGILWQGNATPTPSTNRIDVVTFSILYDGLYTVLGQLTGF